MLDNQAYSFFRVQIVLALYETLKLFALPYISKSPSEFFDFEYQFNGY